MAAIEYIVRFLGISRDRLVRKIARRLATNYRYRDKHYRIQYIMFSKTPNSFYEKKGVQHITLREVVRFLDEERGQCWRDYHLGVGSVHDQWEPLINQAFEIFNSGEDPDERQRRVIRLLDGKSIG